MIGDIGRVWRFRELLRVLVVRNTKIKYQGSSLGFLWTLLNPLLIMAILLAVFTHVIRVPIEDYWAFLLCGYFVYNSIAQTLTAASFVFSEYATMLRSVALPPETPLLAATLSRFLEYLVELVLILVLLALFRHGGVPASFALVPLLVVLQLALSLGLALPLAALSVYYYDIRHMLPIVLTGLFYVSPVFYTADMVPDSVRMLYFANPVAGMLELYHVVLYEGAFPPAVPFLLFIAQVLGVLLIGYALFDRHKADFAEVV
jgi:ABC-type polysaccharide/polyol phosphate export permease